MSRRARAEASADSHAVLLFLRVPGTPLDFVGYVFPAGHASWSYALQRSDPNGLAHRAPPRAVRSAVQPDPPLSPDGDRDLESR